MNGERRDTQKVDMRAILEQSGERPSTPPPPTLRMSRADVRAAMRAHDEAAAAAGATRP